MTALYPAEEVWICGLLTSALRPTATYKSVIEGHINVADFP